MKILAALIVIIMLCGCQKKGVDWENMDYQIDQFQKPTD